MNLLKEHYESILKNDGTCCYSELSKIYTKEQRCSLCGGPRDSSFSSACHISSSKAIAKQKLEEIEKVELLVEKLK